VTSTSEKVQVLVKIVVEPTAVGGITPGVVGVSVEVAVMDNVDVIVGVQVGVGSTVGVRAVVTPVGEMVRVEVF
jgi:hypothetical protein